MTLFEQAKALAPVANARMTAAIVIKDKVIAIGSNLKKSNPFQAKYSRNCESIFFHAETNAIFNAFKLGLNVNDFRKSSLVIVRAKFTDHSKKHFCFGLAKPCDGCMKAIEKFEIPNVYFSTDDQEIQSL